MLEPKSFEIEKTTIWSFPERGDWATHSGAYRGNWSPYIPRNLILRYTKPNDWVLDQFMGSGTTIVEAKLLNRNVIGVDINPQAVALTENNLKFSLETKSETIIKNSTAIDLNFIENNYIDLICMHPPYSNIIKYSEEIDGDLSILGIEDFLIQMKAVAKESFRVLNNNKYCTVMMGDIRKNSKVIPLGYKVMECFLEEDFKLQEIIIKEQHNCKSSKYWNRKNLNFLLLAHEYIFVFQKQV